MDDGILLNVVQYPAIAADHAARANCHGTEYGGSSVDHHIVADSGVPGKLRGRVLGRIAVRCARAECDMLIDSHPRTDLRRFADNHPGAMVDKECQADFGAGMNVYARAHMRRFRNDPRYNRKSQPMNFMGDAVPQYSLRTRIAEQNLLDRPGSWVAKERGLDVGINEDPDARQRSRENSYDTIDMTWLEFLT